jgi:preprotein translocase subunit SecA
MSVQSKNITNKYCNDNGALLAPHPGIYSGQYPTKKQQSPGWLTVTVQRVKKSFADIVRAHQKAHREMLERVHTNHTVITSMSDAQLNKWIIDIKRKLHSKGLTDELLCRAFATIKEVATRELNMSHYDSQLLGGWIMMQGMVAEMQTGEGKTLTATLPAGCAAMAGMPVHVVTVNDYLVKRDAEIMLPVYKRLGLTVGCVVDGMSEQERQQAYRCDITYCTSKQLVFDYLRDRMVLKQFNTELDLKLSSLYQSTPVNKKLLLRGLCFAVVDEADSVFIDEARTPLILSCKSENNQKEEIHREAVWLAKQLDNDIYYSVEFKAKQVSLSAQGKEYLQELTANMRGIWRGERKRKALVEQALSALHCYEKDVHYIIDEGRVQIIDENTGRSMPDRSWEAGLHQMIEEKEQCEQTGQNQTIARISYQRFFSRYLKLSGMTGTAKEVAGELWGTYGLAVHKVPTHKPSRRNHEKTTIYYTQEEKWLAVADDTLCKQASNRPVLIGTRTVKDSEHISELLKLRECKHQVLNAKFNKQEAEIIAEAGKAGCVTVSTNMAGRGTDIKLDATAEQAGGLHVICCERNDSRRIDRQLAGRSARQGDPGSYKVICSIEDDGVIKYFSSITLMLLRYRYKRNLPVGAIVRPRSMARALVNIPQRIMEYNHRQIRKSMMKIDQKRESMLGFTGESD